MLIHEKNVPIIKILIDYVCSVEESFYLSDHSESRVLLVVVALERIGLRPFVHSLRGVIVHAFF